MDSENQLSEDEVVRQCIEAATKTLPPKIAVSFLYVEEKNGSLVAKETTKELYPIESIEVLKKYVDEYQNKYRAVNNSTSLIPPALEIDSCVLDGLPLQRINTSYVFNNSKINIDINDNAIKIAKAYKCDISANKKNIFAAFLEESLFRNEVEISYSAEINQGYTLIGIKKCLFQKGLALKHKHPIINCEINGRLELSNRGSSVFAEVSNSSASTLDIHAAIILNIQKCKIGSFIVRNSPNLVKANFEETIFKDMFFENCEFKSRNVNFREVEFEDKSSSQALGNFRSLKYACEQAGYEHGVILFHGLELETYYNLNLKGNTPTDWVEKIASLLHKFTTDYGRNITRAFGSILLIFLAMVVVNSIDPYEWSGIWSYVACSFKDSLGPLVFALHDMGKQYCNGYSYWWIKVLQFIQVVITSTLWFVAILMIRRRFKL